MKVGFIGLGHMGAGMAANLLKAGHDVTVYNRTRMNVEALVAQGAKAAAGVSDACRGDTVITMLANDDAVESVVFSDVWHHRQPARRGAAYFFEHHQRCSVGKA
jgi:3-hydroxyisobutyrate dehydrogenase-like beta-hydroxyacid dehydrogenase